MTQNRNNRPKHVGALFSLAVIFLLGVYAWDARYDDMRGAASQAARIATAAGSEEVSIGRHWDLVDHQGKKVDQDSYPGKHRLVFFGFASCPDICPTTLQKIGKALEMLGGESESLVPLFITTDPATDVPAVMARYVAQFGPQFVGLTGTQEQIDATLESFRAYAEKIDDGSGGYFMNHSSVVYFMSPDNELISVFDSTDSPVDMMKEIRRVLPQG